MGIKQRFYIIFIALLASFIFPNLQGLSLTGTELDKNLGEVASVVKIFRGGNYKKGDQSRPTAGFSSNPKIAAVMEGEMDSDTDFQLDGSATPNTIDQIQGIIAKYGKDESEINTHEFGKESASLFGTDEAADKSQRDWMTNGEQANDAAGTQVEKNHTDLCFPLRCFQKNIWICIKDKGKVERFGYHTEISVFLILFTMIIIIVFLYSINRAVNNMVEEVKLRHVFLDGRCNLIIDALALTNGNCVKEM